jgi:hypothetical protein
LWVIFALLVPDPDFEYGSGSTDLIESGSNPDQKPWQRCDGIGSFCVLGEYVPMLRIRDVYPGSRSSFLPIPDLGVGSRIPDPKMATKERGEKKFIYQAFFCSHKFHKIEYYFVLKC